MGYIKRVWYSLTDYLRYDFNYKHLLWFIPSLVVLVYFMQPLAKEQELLEDKGEASIYVEVEQAIAMAKGYIGSEYVLNGGHEEELWNSDVTEKELKTDTSSFVRLAYGSVGIDIGEGTTISYKEKFKGISKDLEIGLLKRGDIIIDNNKMGIALDKDTYIGNLGSGYGKRLTDGVQIASIKQSLLTEEVVVVSMEDIVSNKLYTKIDSQLNVDFVGNISGKSINDLATELVSAEELENEIKVTDGYYLFLIDSPEVENYVKLLKEYETLENSYPIYYYDMSEGNVDGVELGKATYKALTGEDFDLYSDYILCFVSEAGVISEDLLTKEEKELRRIELNSNINELFLYTTNDLEFKFKTNN